MNNNYGQNIGTTNFKTKKSEETISKKIFLSLKKNKGSVGIDFDLPVSTIIEESPTEVK